MALSGHLSSARLWPVIQIESVKTIIQKAESVISSGTDVTEFIPIVWYKDIVENSAVSGSVSSAHRALVAERDRGIVRYIEGLKHDVERVFDRCNTLLDQVSEYLQYPLLPPAGRIIRSARVH